MRHAIDMLRHPSRMFDHGSDAHSPRKALHSPFAMGGLVALILLALGVYWLMPEIRRYLRIERM